MHLCLSIQKMGSLIFSLLLGGDNIFSPSSMLYGVW